MAFPALSDHDVLRLGDGYRVEWPDDGIRLEVHHLRESHGDILAELTWYERGEAAWDRIRGGGRLNLLAPESIRRTAKVLMEIHGANFDWPRALERACIAVVDEHRRGEPTVCLHEIADTPVSQRFLLPPFVPEGVTTVFHADPESGKSMLAKGILLSIATGVPLAGYVPLKTGPVLYLDWETDRERWARRMRRLVSAAALSGQPLPIYYRRMSGALKDQVSQVKEVVDRHRVIAVVIDSLAWASGAEELGDSKPAIACMEAARSLGVTVIGVAHQTKESRYTGRASIFGSVFFEAAARNVWQLKASPQGEEIAMLLHHRKNNDGPKLKTPIPLRLLFDDEGARFIPGVIVSESSSLSARILRTIEESPWITGTEIAAMLDHNPESIRKTLTRMEESGEVIRTGGGRGRGNAAMYALPDTPKPADQPELMAPTEAECPYCESEPVVYTPKGEPRCAVHAKALNGAV